MKNHSQEIGAALLAVFLLILPTSILALPTIRFVAAEDSVEEANTNHPVALVISEPPTTQTYVSIELSSTTAEPGYDYVGGSTLTWFTPDGPDTVYAYVQLYDDLEAEGAESITLTIQDNPSYFETGFPSSMELNLIDNDAAGPTARFVFDEDIPLSLHGDVNLATQPGTEVELTIEIDQLPAEGATVTYAVDGIQHMLSFTDQTRETITVTSPEIPGGDYHAIRNISIIGSNGNKTEAEDVGVAAIDDEALTSISGCFACTFAYLGMLITNGNCYTGLPSCGLLCSGNKTAEQQPTGTRSFASDLETLRNYRDSVLLASPVGSYYVQLHEDLKDDLALAILADPTLVARGRQVWDEWIPIAEALVQGNGEGTTITPSMMDGLLGLMDEMAAAGTPELGQAFSDLRKGMGLDDGPPASADEMQVRVENSSTETLAQPWDGVKALYR